MELTTDSTARVATDILIAALESKAIGLSARSTKKQFAEEIVEVFKIIHRAVLDAANGTPP